MAPLRLDSACCRRAHWRTELPRGLDAERFEREMEVAGWTSRCRHPALKVFRHVRGHEVAWVLATGRVQIRIDFEVPERRRRRRAVALWRELGACLERLEGAPAANGGTR